MNDTRLRVSGDYLKELRQKKGLTTAQVADFLGCSPGYVNHLETGKKDNPSYRYLVRMAELYGVSIEDLVGDKKADPALNVVDIVKELYMADVIIFEGQEIDVRDPIIAERIEMGIRLGVAWALQRINESKGEKKDG
jgi:transcriptional regulator with XRE-family HTH domain